MTTLQVIKELENKGLSPKEATIIIRNIAIHWYNKGAADMLNTTLNTNYDRDPFDTQFNKELSKPIKNGKSKSNIR